MEKNYEVYVKDDKIGFFMTRGKYKGTVVSVNFSDDIAEATLTFVEVPDSVDEEDEVFLDVMSEIVNEILKEAIAFGQEISNNDVG